MEAGARVIHVDVMDGHFVPPITIGPLVTAAIADQVHDRGGALDVHMMIEMPERQLEAFASAGADSITFHLEATPHANRTLAAIRDLGCLAGVAINPGTPAAALAELAGCADLVLCMSVNPGWGGAVLHRGLDREARPPWRDPRRRHDRGRRRHRPNHRQLGWRAPAPRSLSPARRSSAAPIRPAPTPRSPPPRGPPSSDVLVDRPPGGPPVPRAEPGLGYVLGALVGAAVDVVKEPQKRTPRRAGSRSRRGGTRC